MTTIAYHGICPWAPRQWVPYDNGLGMRMWSQSSMCV